MSTILATCLNPLHTFSKLPQTSIHLLAGLGVQGDAHCGETVQHLYLKKKTPHAPNRMQVHLLQSELFPQLADAGHTLHPGQLGENITTQGIDLVNLPLGTRLHLGAHAIVELTGLRTPCRKIDTFQPGLQSRLVDRSLPPKRRGKAGIMAIVVHSGTCWPGDTLCISLPAGAPRPLIYI